MRTVNKAKYNALSPHNKDIVETAATDANASMMVAYDVRNTEAYGHLVANGQFIGVFPDGHLGAAYTKASEFYKAEAATNADFKRLHEFWTRLSLDVTRWHNTAEATMQATMAKRLIC